MEREDLSFTTPEGEKVYGLHKPPEDIEEQLRRQQEREFRQAKELSENLEPDESSGEKDKKGKIIEMPGRNKKAPDLEKGKEAA